MGRAEPAIAFKTFGCRVKQADSDALVRKFRARGFAIVPFGAPADAVVMNTCTITHVADRKARKAISRALRNHPDAVVAITGCYATVQEERLTELFPGARVFPILDQDRMIEEIGELAGAGVGDGEAGRQGGSGKASRARPIVKVQEGCDHVCAFCIVPRARGRSRSRSADEIVNQIRELTAEGAAEVMVSGVSLGRYLCPESGDRVGGLVARILEETEVPRLRVSSVEPMDFDRALLDSLSDLRLSPHLHLPLQSGLDAILKAMRRPYTAAEYRELIEAVRAVSPEVAIGADVMVGFPGETEADFAATVGLIEELEFASLHVFPYSKRSRTLAALNPDSVEDSVKRARVSELLELGAEGSFRYAARFSDTVREVLWESESDGSLTGLSDNYLRVTGPGEAALVGRLGPARLHVCADGTVQAVPLVAAMSGGA